MSETEELEVTAEATGNESGLPEVSDLIAQNWRTLVRPRGITGDKSNTKNYGKFSIAPLERGYGITLGNSLRRILLSSLCGAAITGVRITGVSHEFTSIPGRTSRPR